MRFIWIPALTLVTGVLGSPLAPAGPQLQVEQMQFVNVSTLLPDLLHAIQGQTGAIGKLSPSSRPGCNSSFPRKRSPQVLIAT